MAGQRQRLTSFKAYDIRGRIPDELDADLARKIGRAYATFLKPRRVVVGHDIRLSSPEIAGALSEGLLASGVDVIDIGLCGTEMVYFATFHEQLDGGIMVTASHNPKDYNGLKLVREQSKPISGDTGLKEIERIILEDRLAPKRGGGTRTTRDIHEAYIEHLLGYIDHDALRPLKVVANGGNGGAGPIVRRLAERLPFELVEVYPEPDGNFPNGIPNPLLPGNRRATVEAIRASGADVGLAWDGDFDRCFLFDERGGFIEGYYIVGLLAERVLQINRGAAIVHDPRLTWNTVEIVERLGGRLVQSKSGHAFIKEVMRREDAAYGGEMSAHHYFREFAYCDSGMLPWLLVLEQICRSGKPLSELVGERMRAFPASGEINRRVQDAAADIARIRAHYETDARRIDETDGVSIEFDSWRFNLRMSNTEPLIRLNVEARGDETLMRDKTEEVLGLLGGEPA